MTIWYGNVGKFRVDPTDSNSTVELYGNSQSPRVRFWLSGPPQTSTESNHAVHNHGFGFNVMSGGGVFKYSGYAQRKNAAADNTRVDHDGDTVEEGPVFLVAATDTEWSNVVSVGQGTVYTQEGDVATDGFYYNAMVLAGSVSAEIVNTQTVDHGASSGTTYTFSWGFQPDFVIGMHYFTNVGNQYNAHIYNGITILDYRHKKYQVIVNQQNLNTNKFSQFQSSSVAMPLIVGDAAYYDSYFDVVSWGTDRTVFEVRSPFGSPFGDPFLPGLLAIKQDDSAYGHQIANVVLGAAGTKSIQTNSLSPEGMFLYTTDCGTLDNWVSSSNVRSAEGFALNFWTKSEGTGHSMSHALMGDDTDEHSRVSSLGVLVGILANVDSIGYTVGDITAGSGGFSFSYTVNDTGKFGNVRLGFAALGKSVNAPEHLMDANSVSIFLADDSDYYDNLLLVDSAVFGVTSTAFRTSMITSSLDQGTITETYSIDGNIPKVRFGISAIGVAGINTVQTTAERFNFGTAVFSSDGLGFNETYLGWRVEDGFSILNVDGTLRTGRCDGFIQAGGDIVYLIQATSAAANTINVDGDTPRSTNQYPYKSAVLAGSLSAHSGLADVLVVNSVGATTTVSLGFQPDIILTHFVYGNASITNSEGIGESFGFAQGFYNVRSSYGWYLYRLMDDSGAVPIQPQVGISSTMIRVARGTPVAWQAEVKSVGASGFMMETTSLISSTETSRRIGFTAIKFDDPTVDFDLWNYSLPLSSSTVTRTLGFAPKFVYHMGTSVKTLAHFQNSAQDGISESHNHGFWTEGATPSLCWGWTEGSDGTPDSHCADYHGKLGMFVAGIGTTEVANIRSVTVQASTNLQYYADVLSTSGQELTGFFLSIGVNEGGGAPPSSSGPGSSGPGGALFRAYPDTDDREFPTPLTNVRAFPSD